MAGVDYIRLELSSRFHQYEKIDDCAEGQDAVKSRGARYLPIPNAEIDAGNSVKLTTRYAGYKERAVFINYTGKTLEGLTGMVFDKEPQLKLTPLLEIIKKNADGSGVDLIQLTKNLITTVIKKGRAGILTDYPERDTPASIAEVEAGDVRPVIMTYGPEAVINWDTGIKGSKTYLTLVVIHEKYSERLEGDFEVKIKDQWRVLELIDPTTGKRQGDKLTDNVQYRVRIIRKSESFISSNPVKAETAVTNGGFIPPATVQASTSVGWQETVSYPKDGANNPLTEIPFTFVGSVSNNGSVDKPPLLDIANANIAHYRASADVNDSAYLVGQPTPWASGLTQTWVDRNFPNGVVLGSRSALLLQKDSQVGMLQADPNTMAQQAMKDCEEQIKSLGAKITETTSGPAKTATEAGGDLVAENSLLGTIAGNVEAAMKYALEWCAIFTNEISQNRDAKDNSISFILNKKYDRMFMSSADRAQLQKEWEAGGISYPEYRDNLRASGVRLGDDDDNKKLIDQEQSDNLDFETERLKAQAEASGKLGGNTQTQKPPTPVKQAA